MTRYPFISRTLVCVFLLFFLVAPAKAQTADEKTVEQAFPGLATDILGSAGMVQLEPGVILQSGGIEIRESQLRETIEKVDPGERDQLKKNLFFLLERETVKRIVVREAEQSGFSRKGRTEEQVVQDYLNMATGNISVTDEEVRAFYDKNKEMLGGKPLEQIKYGLEAYILQNKKADIIGNHIRELIDQTDIRINERWVKAQYDVAMENPVDRARMSGKPTMVEFGASGCVPCDMMQPILDKLRKKFPDKLNVVFVHVRKEPILGERFGIRAIPVQVFFNKNGREVFRHTGFYPEAEILKQLAGLGVE